MVIFQFAMLVITRGYKIQSSAPPSQDLAGLNPGQNKHTASEADDAEVKVLPAIWFFIEEI